MARDSLPLRLQALLNGGENETVEFRKSLSGGVFGSISALSNASGGYIFAGVKRDGTVTGTEKKQRKDFQKELSVKIRPEVFLSVEEYETEGKVIVFIKVPASVKVVRADNRIYIRKGAEDRDITDDQDAVFRLYTAKTTTSYVDTVTSLGYDSLREDLIGRVKGDGAETADWLREEGLLLKDPYTLDEGVTIAAVLLFGTDGAIRQAAGQCRTELVVNSERKVLSGNLIETYEEIIAAAPGNAALEAVASNFLVHRDYTSSMMARISVVGNVITSENPSVPKGYDAVFVKNPALSRVFRAFGFASEAGEGFRLLRKSASLAVSDGEVFKVSLSYASESKDDEARVRLSEERLSSLLDYCSEPRTRQEIQDFLGIRTVEYVRKRIIKPMLLSGLVARTIPDKPNSRNQKYIRL